MGPACSAASPAQRRGAAVVATSRYSIPRGDFRGGGRVWRIAGAREDGVTWVRELRTLSRLPHPGDGPDDGVSAPPIGWVLDVDRR